MQSEIGRALMHSTSLRILRIGFDFCDLPESWMTAPLRMYCAHPRSCESCGAHQQRVANLVVSAGPRLESVAILMTLQLTRSACCSVYNIIRSPQGHILDVAKNNDQNYIW
jgi:hypothetical protein